MIAPAIPRSFASAILSLLLAVAGCNNHDFEIRHPVGEIDIYDDLFSLSVADERHVVAVGYHGAAYWSEDGGETWHKGQTSTERALYSVSMADRQRGWAVGQLGTILRTENGGRTWRAQPNPKREEGSHLFGVHALDRDTAIAVGEWGARISTADGGRVWVDRSLGVGPDHPQFVWLSSEDQERVRTGGVVYEDVSLQDVFCLRDSAHCWLVGEFGYIFHSQDSGASWTRGAILGEVRMEPLRLDFDQVELDAADAERLASFARKIEHETHLNVLIDPFVSDREIDTHHRGDGPEDLFDLISARLDEARGVLEAAGLTADRIRAYDRPPWDYADFVEHDGAFLTRYIESRRAREPLLAVSVIQNPFLFTVRFETPSQGLVSGLGGVILRSDDGGRSWRYVETSRRQALFSVAASDARTVAVGEKGLVQISEDGGRSWSPPGASQFPPVFTYMRDLHFAPDNPKVGFIVGQDGMVLRSRDGGAHWIQQLPPPDRRPG
jgi:photosystem II stability/assembly factor-like uncharacterized protein